MFGSRERFLAMVRGQLPGRLSCRRASPSSIPLRVEGDLVQGVHLTDGAGALWLAIYRLERQPDRIWRITGCDVQPATGKMI